MQKILLILAMLTIPLTSIGEVRNVQIIGPRVSQPSNNPSTRVVRFYLRNTHDRPLLWACYNVHFYDIYGREAFGSKELINSCTNMIYPDAEPTLITLTEDGFRTPTYRVEIEVTEAVFGESDQ